MEVRVRSTHLRSAVKERAWLEHMSGKRRENGGRQARARRDIEIEIERLTAEALEEHVSYRSTWLQKSMNELGNNVEADGGTRDGGNDANRQNEALSEKGNRREGQLVVRRNDVSTSVPGSTHDGDE